MGLSHHRVYSIRSTMRQPSSVCTMRSWYWPPTVNCHGFPPTCSRLTFRKQDRARRLTVAVLELDG